MALFSSHLAATQLGHFVQPEAPDFERNIDKPEDIQRREDQNRKGN